MTASISRQGKSRVCCSSLGPHCLVCNKHSIPFISNTNELSKLCLGGAFYFLFVCMGVVSWSKPRSLHMLASSVPLSYIPRPSKWLLLRCAEGCRDGCRAWRGPEIDFQDPRGPLTTFCNSCSKGLWQPLLAPLQACIHMHIPTHIYKYLKLTKWILLLERYSKQAYIPSLHQAHLLEQWFSAFGLRPLWAGLRSDILHSRYLYYGS